MKELPRKNGLLCKIQGVLGANGENDAKKIIIGWAEDLTGLTVNRSKSFSGDNAFTGKRLKIESDGSLWTLQLRESDRYGREWTTEATIIENKGRSYLGVNVACNLKKSEKRAKPSVPPFVKTIIESVGLYDGRAHIPNGLQTITDVPSSFDLAGKLGGNARRPMIIAALKGNAKRASLFPHDMETLARKASPMADIFVIAAETRKNLETSFGHDFVPAANEILLFKPDLGLEGQPEILRFPITDQTDHQDLARLLISEVAKASLEAQQNIPTFDQALLSILDKKARRGKKGAPATAELQELIDALAGQLNEAQDELETTRELLEVSNKENQRLKAQLAALQAQISAPQPQKLWPTNTLELWRRGVLETCNLPDRYDLIPGWCAEILGDRLVLLPSALRDLKKDPNTLYHSPQTVCESLLFLAQEFRDKMAEPGQDREAAFQERLKKHHFEFSKTTLPAKGKNIQAAYFVQVDGELLFLDYHLKRGNSIDPKNCLRVYLLYDSPSRKVHVGHLPYHLPNSLTN